LCKFYGGLGGVPAMVSLTNRQILMDSRSLRKSTTKLTLNRCATCKKSNLHIIKHNVIRHGKKANSTCVGFPKIRSNKNYNFENRFLSLISLSASCNFQQLGEQNRGGDESYLLFLVAMFYVYILYSESADRYYIGHTNDPERRLVEHNTSELGKPGEHN
jgi:hypothetical protein